MSTTTHTLPDGRQYTPSLEGMPPRSLAPSKAARIVTIVALTFTMLYFVLPIIWVMFSSTKSNADLVSTNGFWFGHFELGDNYTKLMGWTQGLGAQLPLLFNSSRDHRNFDFGRSGLCNGEIRFPGAKCLHGHDHGRPAHAGRPAHDSPVRGLP